MFKKNRLAILLILLLTSACSVHIGFNHEDWQNSEEFHERTVKVKEEVEDDEQLYYNPDINKLLVYYPLNQTIELWNDEDNQFQYSVDLGNIFVNGNSDTNEFELMKLKGGSLKTIHKFNKGEGLFPLGQIDNDIYFIHCYYKEDGEELENKRRISVFNLKTKEMEDFPETQGLIESGAVDEELVYYSFYNPEDEDYSLVKIQRDDIAATPELVKSHLPEGFVLARNGDVFYSDGKDLVSDDTKWKKESENFIYKDLLVQFTIDDESGLSVKLTDFITDETLVVEDIIGIRVEDHQLNIGKIGELVTYDLLNRNKKVFIRN